MNPDYAYAGYCNLDDSTSDVTTRQFLNSGQDWKLWSITMQFITFMTHSELISKREGI